MRTLWLLFQIKNAAGDDDDLGILGVIFKNHDVGTLWFFASY